MPATSPVQLSYDVFVSDGPARSGGERMPDGALLALRGAEPGPRRISGRRRPST
jgi:hypothetical protein